MIKNDKIISQTLHELGLDTLTITIFQLILFNSVKSVSNISKQLNISRYKVEISLEKLMDLDLIVKVREGNLSVFDVTNSRSIEELVKNKLNNLQNLISNIPYINDIYLKRNQNVPDFKVRMYSGEQGFVNVTKRMISTKGVFRIFELDYLQDESDPEFGEYIRREFVKNNIQIHQITNKEIYPFKTKVTQIIDTKYWQLRYLDSQKLLMKYEMVVYNNVFVMYHFEKGEFFGVEIENIHLSKIQKQIFDYIWNDSVEMVYDKEKEILTPLKKSK